MLKPQQNMPEFWCANSSSPGLWSFVPSSYQIPRFTVCYLVQKPKPHPLPGPSDAERHSSTGNHRSRAELVAEPEKIELIHGLLVQKRTSQPTATSISTSGAANPRHRNVLAQGSVTFGDLWKIQPQYQYKLWQDRKPPSGCFFTTSHSVAFLTKSMQ